MSKTLKNVSLIITLIAIGIGVISISALRKNEVIVNVDDSVHQVLAQLGEKESKNIGVPSMPMVSAEAGERMVLEGFSIDGKGKRYAKLSNHFVCTSCHNIQKETEDLTLIDPQERLEYAKANNLPFLQGSSLYGIVNRASFYNGDYVKKYGDLAKKANKDIREAIQLCAIECAQGRKLKPWELESILAYLWKLELKIDDLNLTDTEMKTVQDAINNDKDQESAIALLQSKYRKDSPATFGRPPDDMLKGYEYEGNADNGRTIYELSCQHCHENQRYSFFELDDSKMTFDYLQKHMKRHRRFSFYWVSRYGTKPIPGKKAYMPHYTEERMSDQQLEDLRAYIDMKAGK